MRHHFKALLGMALPLMGSHIVQLSLQLTDAAMLGRFDIAALSAAVLASSYSFVIWIVGTGFSAAVTPLIIDDLSNNETQRARVTLVMGLLATFIYAIIALPMLLLSDVVLAQLGQTPNIAKAAGLYLKITAVGFIPSLLIVAFNSALIAKGRTPLIFIVALLSFGLNVLLNWVLIFGNVGFPALGLAGAAWSTIGVQTLSCLATIVFVGRFAKFGRQGWHFQITFVWPVFMKVVRLGLPIGLTSLAELGMFTAATLMVGTLGTVPLAAHGIVIQLTSAAFTVQLGLSEAATAHASKYFGQRQFCDIRKISVAVLTLSAVLVLATSSVLLLFPESLAQLFMQKSDSSHAVVFGIVLSILVVAVLSQFADAAQLMGLAMLRSIQKTVVPMRLAIVSYWVIGVPAAYLLMPRFMVPGIWAGLALGLVASGTLLWVYFLLTIRKQKVPCQS